MIPLAYIDEIIGLTSAGVSANAEFNVKIFMVTYIAICILTFAKFIYDKNKHWKEGAGHGYKN